MTESLTTQQACAFLGCGRDTLRKHVKAGRVKLCSIGREHRYLKDDLKALFDYASRGDNAQVDDQQPKEIKQCPSTNVVMFGGFASPVQTAKRYEEVLGRKTKKKPNNCMTN